MDGEIVKNEAEPGPVDWTEKPQNIGKKSKREYDIIVFGASGFTGKFVVKEMDYFSRIYNLTWAIAGRNVNKLQNVLNDLYKTRSDDMEEKKIEIIHADVQDIKTVMKMAQIASVIINCVGPYYIYGEVVVKSCVLNSTHYVDITGESLFMEKMAYIYNTQAEENRSLIVSALGMESVPADLGVEFLCKNFHGELDNVDIYMKLHSGSFVLNQSAIIHDGTWISAILHLATTKERLYYRKLLDESMGITRTEPNVTKILHSRELCTRNREKEWNLAFPEPDQAVIARSIHHAKTVDNLPYNFTVRNYMVFGNLVTAIFALIGFVYLSVLTTFEPIRILLVRFPKIFTLGMATKTGPNEKIMKNSKLLLTLIGYGSSLGRFPATNFGETTVEKNYKKKMIVKVEARDPGYGFTSKAVVLGAITILKDHDKIPKGGVLTPAAAFRKSRYINRLIEHDAANFEITFDLMTHEEHVKSN